MRWLPSDRFSFIGFGPAGSGRPRTFLAARRRVTGSIPNSTRIAKILLHSRFMAPSAEAFNVRLCTTSGSRNLPALHIPIGHAKCTSIYIREGILQLVSISRTQSRAYTECYPHIFCIGRFLVGYTAVGLSSGFELPLFP